MLKHHYLLFVTIFLITLNSNAQFSKCSDQEEFPEFKSSLCTTVKTPLNYQSNTNQTLDIFVRKFPSLKKRKGSIWLIAGGPGESGASFYPLINQFSKLFPHLDIFVPDHRGTGFSSKICPKQESIDSPNGIALANNEWGPCFGQMFSNKSYTQAFSITNAANDLSVLMNQLSGKGKRYVYGVSYGTQLVLRLLQLNSVKIDSVILDSLVPLQDDTNYDLSQRSFVTNNVGRAVLDLYNKLEPNNTVSLNNQLKNILKKTQNNSDFAKKFPKQDLSIILGMMLDIPEVRNKIPTIIKALANNNVEPLNSAIADITKFYTEYGAKYKTSSNSIPLTQVITGSENNLKPEAKKSDVTKESKGLLFTSPLPKLIAENSMPTYQRDNYFAKVPKNMPPTLIIHGTLDPKTHYNGALRHYKKMAKNNDIKFIGVKDAPHFIALFAPTAFTSTVISFMNGQKLTNKTIIDKNTLIK
ncbi:alpha/beta fold hydrolase [Tenacibaculum aiptasiae]|uniref:alpha/beta fold hydrolase n=1 Tax=Tenacibaculum aiptasiae TaxID=426481 RepID=UPI00232F427A|nr:alpha/beta hydrolase [Tenacibaculum aiptasiae]